MNVATTGRTPTNRRRNTPAQRYRNFSLKPLSTKRISTVGGRADILELNFVYLGLE